MASKSHTSSTDPNPAAQIKNNHKSPRERHIVPTKTAKKTQTTKKASAKTSKPDDTKETTGSTMPNKFVLGSRKLFDTKAPWRINNSLIGQLNTDHYIAMFDRSAKDTYDYGIEIYKRLSRILKNFPFENKVFIGYKRDCLMAPSLKTQFKIDFDTVILIDNPFPQQAYDPILKTSNIYNISTKERDALDYLPSAKVNQMVPTILPAHMSNRVHLEATGLLIYGAYNTNHISQETKSILVEL